MKLRYRVAGQFLLLAAITLPLSVSAQEAEAEGPWSGSATLGYLATSGNSESSTLNTGVSIGYATGLWAHSAQASAISASESEVTTAEAYTLGWKSERKLTDNDFLFGRLDWRKDRFGGYAKQFSQTIGYGRRLIESEKHKLNAELGLGARQSELQSGVTEDETVIRGGTYYTWSISETAEFHQDLTVESGSDNTFLESYTSLSAKLLGDLALVAAFTVRHNTDAPPLTEETDTYTALSLEYSF